MIRNSFIAALVLIAGLFGSALAQGNIRESQFADFLYTSGFNGQRVELNCPTNSGIGIGFSATRSANRNDRKVPEFGEFQKIRPNALPTFNGGMFMHAATAIGDAWTEVCAQQGVVTTTDLGGEDPLIDAVNLSDIDFDYNFSDNRAPGGLAVHLSRIPVVELDVAYINRSFTDTATGVEWEYQSSELLATINNFQYYDVAEDLSHDADPDPNKRFIKKRFGSFPCYYVHIELRTVYRFPLRDCNSRTPVGQAPLGVSLREATEELALHFIENNIDIAGGRSRAPVAPAQLTECCRTSRKGGIFSSASYSYIVMPQGLCSERVVAPRYCTDEKHVERNPSHVCCSDGAGEYRVVEKAACEATATVVDKFYCGPPPPEMQLVCCADENAPRGLDFYLTSENRCRKATHEPTDPKFCGVDDY
ncbi:MAG: hypothetical protein AAGD92_04645 [Pseudomonadota bacterium]